MKAVLCPVCRGEGRYKDKPCHGCGGRGWVEVREISATSPPSPLPPGWPQKFDTQTTTCPPGWQYKPIIG